MIFNLIFLTIFVILNIPTIIMVYYKFNPDIPKKPLLHKISKIAFRISIINVFIFNILNWKNNRDLIMYKNPFEPRLSMDVVWFLIIFLFICSDLNKKIQNLNN